MLAILTVLMLTSLQACLGQTENETEAEKDYSDKEFMDKYDEIIPGIACNQTSETNSTAMKVNLTRYATRFEMAKLAFWNYGNDFNKTKLVFPKEFQWIRDVVDKLYDIWHQFCPSSAVPDGFIKVMRELTLIYLNSVDPELNRTQTKDWIEVQKQLDQCELKIGKEKQYNFTYTAMKISGIQDVEKGIQETAELLPPEEKADQIYANLDLVIDTFWWVFSHALGKCWKFWDEKYIAKMIPKMRVLFIHDIFRPMLNRWAAPGPYQDFGPVIGNVDLDRATKHVRYCVTAAYLTNNVLRHQLVRPLKVGHVIGNVTRRRNSLINRKTGNKVGDGMVPPGSIRIYSQIDYEGDYDTIRVIDDDSVCIPLINTVRQTKSAHVQGNCVYFHWNVNCTHHSSDRQIRADSNDLVKTGINRMQAITFCNRRG